MKKIINKNPSFSKDTFVIISFVVISSLFFSFNFVNIHQVFGYGGDSSSGSSSTTETPSCNDFKPSSAPDLFQINTNNNSAKLFFTPISSTNTYYISFSTNPSAEQHGVQVTLAREGVQNFTVDLLKYNATYYFKVRGQNGCMPGEWSNIMQVTTRSRFLSQAILFFKNNVSRPIAGLFQKTTSLAVQTPDSTFLPGEENIGGEPLNQPESSIVPQQRGEMPVVNPPAEQTQPKVGFWDKLFRLFGLK